MSLHVQINPLFSLRLHILGLKTMLKLGVTIRLDYHFQNYSNLNFILKATFTGIKYKRLLLRWKLDDALENRDYIIFKYIQAFL